MNFVKGMDLSTLAELEKCGAKYYDASVYGMIRGQRPENLTVPGKMIQRHRLKSQNV